MGDEESLKNIKTDYLNIIYRYRYLLGALFLLIAVVFEFSGSSIACWQLFMPDSGVSDTGVIFGGARTIRSDEWAVFTPMSLSQGEGGYSVFENIFRGTETDMFIVYGQPVLDWSVIFRPFQWGYLFLTPAKGLSFYWVGKFIALLLVSFDMGMLITKKNKLYSSCFAVGVALAPIVQWWFCANAFPELLIFGQAAVLLLNAYIKTDKYLYRILCGLGMIICAGGYLLVFYPAQQIPFFYAFLALAIWVIIENRKNIVFSLKKDIPIISGILVVFAAAMLLIFVRSGDTVSAVLNTDYPGARFETGGGGVMYFGLYPGNFFTPYITDNLPLNQSETAAFMDLFPLGIILSSIVIFKEKNKDKLLISLFTAGVFLSVFAVFGFPSFLAKITLLSNATTGRLYTAICFINLIMLIRALSLMKWRVKPVLGVVVSAVLAISVVLVSRNLIYGEYLDIIKFALSALALFVVFLLSFLQAKKMFAAAFLIMMVIVGGFVNPIQKGLDVIYDSELGKAVSEINEAEEGLWIYESGPIAMSGNYLAMFGASTLNTTNTYPALETWEKLDTTGEYKEIYNRYAHITIVLTDKETEFELLNPDHFKLHLNPNDLSVLGVKYIVSSNDLSEFNNQEITFDMISETDLANVYKVVYK